jgi:hypothetical protein
LNDQVHQSINSPRPGAHRDRRRPASCHALP